ncbi:MAG: (d)CMP kinase [Ilumatobacteraceae bacterium]
MSVPVRPMVVAIDGPAGAGKSTVGRAVAARLGLEYLDTGAMYRAVTYGALRRGVPVHDHAAVADLAAELAIEIGDGVVRVDGVDATSEIRGRQVTDAVSAVAANSAVRVELVGRQRAWVRERGGGVLEGRDIGTVVFPDATSKLFVTASPRVRAERRVAELGGDVDDIEAAIVERDRQDSSRHDSPLTEAAGALVIDTSTMSIDEVVDRIVADVRREVDRGPSASAAERSSGGAV